MTCSQNRIQVCNDLLAYGTWNFDPSAEDKKGILGGGAKFSCFLPCGRKEPSSPAFDHPLLLWCPLFCDCRFVHQSWGFMSWLWVGWVICEVVSRRRSSSSSSSNNSSSSSSSNLLLLFVFVAVFFFQLLFFFLLFSSSCVCYCSCCHCSCFLI